jgi:hypothetical protein
MVPVQRLRKHVVFERFLARLIEVASGGWALKGAVALNFRLGTVTRTTNDLDIGTALGECCGTSRLVTPLPTEFVVALAIPTEKKTTVTDVIVAPIDPPRLSFN